MQTTIHIDATSTSEWNHFIDTLVADEGCREALNIAITSDSIWNLLLQFRCGNFQS
jgi:hypothetical protein